MRTGLPRTTGRDAAIAAAGSLQGVARQAWKMVMPGDGWLNAQQLLDAVAVATIAPGPAVITVAFLGHLVAGLPGATLAATGIFLPVWILTVIPAPRFVRHRTDAQLRAVSDGAAAAASGASAGAVIVLGQRAIVDIPTAAIAAASLAILWRFKIPEPILVLAAGGLGLVLWPSVRSAAAGKRRHSRASSRAADATHPRYHPP